MVWVGVGGERDAEPFFSVGAPVDLPVLPGPVAKQRREDLQVWSVLNSLTLSGYASHPIGVSQGSDPPDRVLSIGGRSWNTELTELTVASARPQLAHARQFGRRLDQRLSTAAYPHLRGRLVTLSVNHDELVPPPNKMDPLLDAVEQALAVDKGFVSEGLDISAGPPEHLGTKGFYGDHGPFHIIVQTSPLSPGVTVSCSVNVTMTLSQAKSALNDRITEKDQAPNELLIVTCGAPDASGYVFGADTFLYGLLNDAAQHGTEILSPKPTHLAGILIHQWNTPAILFWGNERAPWMVPVPSTVTG